MENQEREMKTLTLTIAEPWFSKNTGKRKKKNEGKNFRALALDCSHIGGDHNVLYGRCVGCWYYLLHLEVVQWEWVGL